MSAGQMPCECRLCNWRGEDWETLKKHLMAAHDVPAFLEKQMTMKLHAAKDHPDRSENTLGLYDPEDRLLAVVVRIMPRAADDPMGWEHLP